MIPNTYNCAIQYDRGSIATAGEAIKWLKTVGLINNALESEEIAKTVEDTGGVYFVPA